jgi:hypothetical protein
MKDLWEKFDKKAFLEAIKLPLRLFVFEGLGFILDFLILYFAGVDTQLGKILGFIAFTADKYLHEVRASGTKKPLEGWARGLLPF